MYSRVVVTGIGMITPLGLDTPSTWEAVLKGQSGIGRIAAFDPTGFETQIAAEVKGFDPENYIDKKEARRMDRFAQLAVAAAREALAKASLTVTPENATDIGIVIGSGIGGIGTLSQQFQVLLEKGPSRISPFLVPMMIADMAPGQVSIQLGLKGPNFGTVSSCSTGADAIGVACEMIGAGHVPVILAGGTEAPVCPIAVAGFNSAGALSKRNDEPQKASRPFDAHRDGFVIGEGAAVLVLEDLDYARKRGAPILAEVVSYAATSDAHHLTHPAPEGEGGARAMALALKRTGMSPEDIDYINAHGTSTPVNDKFETQAIKSVFGEEAYHIPISSTKSMTGHLLGAAGSVESGFCILAIKNGVIPPTINLETPDPECDLDYTPHIPRRGKVKTALTNSFGFGGHNTTLIFRAFDEA